MITTERQRQEPLRRVSMNLVLDPFANGANKSRFLHFPDIRVWELLGHSLHRCTVGCGARYRSWYRVVWDVGELGVTVERYLPA
jgi:hypothetical protein